MKKLILVSLLTLGSSLFAADIGVSIQTPIGNGGMIGLNFRSDDHRYDNRYRNFDYDRNAYADDFGYYYGYFDRTGYFYNNIFFLFDNGYTYYDRLHRRGHFDSHHPHYRKYKFDKRNDWNRSRNYRNDGEIIYGHYYDRPNNQKPNNYRNAPKQNNNYNEHNKKANYQNNDRKPDNRQNNDRKPDNRNNYYDDNKHQRNDNNHR
ncbi:hypothetical protein AVENP_0298 [Arcobacter venerupis]|uniref:Uncharacterized protein n=1 Tax=Arcobacter venerupis TaxID=1054033 RepID=A0AAE7E3E2_9BACT|nr:hypothetical protein [Arcobacter venerupis]QKF65872.1 hypothetical protein AVENP_0298 [Arcobacter venerupis]RWS49234.1 hypothetical protein CKA56_09210 [Arcobacter venerupis]